MEKLKIEKLIYGGYGMGRLEGKAVFVPFSAPGDIVEVEIVKSRKGYDNALIKNVIEAAGCRVEPECKYYGACGGCHLQHINYATQILWKQLILEEQLCRLGGIADPNVLPTISSALIWGYRNRIQVHKKGKKIGFLQRESDKIIDIDSCPIADPDVNEALQELRKKGTSRSDRVEISKGDIESFSQVNPHTNEELKKVVISWALSGPYDRILELYAGSGNFTSPLAEIAKDIVAVESDERAMEKLKKDDRVKSICSTVEEYFYSPSFVRRGRGEVDIYPSRPPPCLPAGKVTKGRSKFDLILVDPPREGLGNKVVNGILNMRPKRLLYVSCNPSTLSRDIKQMIAVGYKLKRVQPLDMFPQTYHIESISELA